MLKTCIKCEEEKTASEFYKEKRVSDGLSARCKTCAKQDAKTSYENNKEAVKSRQRKKYCSVERRKRTLMEGYNLTVDQYDQMYQDQKGACKICEKNFSRLCVDHDHKSGKVRGLLCDRCNLMLGQSLDNISTLSNAITYLESSRD
jgi:hypothetical protein